MLYDRGMLNPVDLSVLTFEQRGDLIVRLLQQIALLARHQDGSPCEDERTDTSPWRIGERTLR